MRSRTKKMAPTKCSACKKKVGLLGFECAGCALVHCASHRLAEDHTCVNMCFFTDTTKLKDANPKIVPSKIVKI